jgi:hypothetical protein
MRNLGLLAAKFIAKYAISDEPDMSFGVPINAEKTRILKDKLIAVYEKLTDGITKLPPFIKINKEMKGNAVLEELNRLITNYVSYIENHNLKEDFGFSMKIIHELNRLRNNIKGMSREKIFELENAIKSVQDTIWEEGKRILNIHDLRGTLLDFPEDVRNKVDELVPTWDFGPGKNPAYKKIKIRQYETPTDLMKRLMRENEQEEKTSKKKGK